MSQFKKQVMLGLVNSMPNNFISGFESAQRRAEVARQAQLQREALGLKAKEFNLKQQYEGDKVSAMLSRAQSAAKQAQTAEGSLGLNRDKFDDRLGAHERNMQRIVANKHRDAQSATEFAANPVFDPAAAARLQQGATQRDISLTGKKAGAAQSAREAARTTGMEKRKGMGLMPQPMTAAERAEAARKAFYRQQVAAEARAISNDADTPAVTGVYRNMAQKLGYEPAAGPVQGPAPAQPPAPVQGQAPRSADDIMARVAELIAQGIDEDEAVEMATNGE